MGRSRDATMASGKLSAARMGALAAAIVLMAVGGRFCFFTVDNSEYAIVTDFGKPTQVVTSPGLGIKFPYQSVRTFDHRLYVAAPPPSEFLTLEKTPVVAAGTVLWRVAEPSKFLETVFDRIGAESRLGDILFAELGAAIGRNPLVAFVSIEPKAFRAETILAEV